MLANYTRTTFGGRQDSDLTAADVARAISPDEEMSDTLRSLQVAAWVGLIGGIGLLVFVPMLWWWLARRRGLKRQEG